MPGSVVPAKWKKAYRISKEKTEGMKLDPLDLDKLEANSIVKVMREKLQNLKTKYDTESESVINPLISEVEIH